MTIKPPILMLGGFFSTFNYEAGGSGSLLGGTSGFLRSMKKPTTSGIMIMMIERHRST
jgi:hypothetical protein